MAVVIAQESPHQPQTVRLSEELDAYQKALYPADSAHLLDADALGEDNVRLFVAREDGEALGCGALRLDAAAGTGEIKRMWVQPAARGRGIGRALLQRLEQLARAEGCTVLQLQSGIHQPESLALYRAAGYLERGPFGDHRQDPFSVFMEKML